MLRIRADDPDARVPLGLKYGANLEDVPRLLQHAKGLGLKVRSDTGLRAPAVVVVGGGIVRVVVRGRRGP